MDRHNPYEAPRAAVTGPDTRLPIQPAGRWRRFFNLLIDYVCYSLLIWVVTAVVILSGAEAVIGTLEVENPPRDFAMALLTVFLYYVPMEGLFGATFGKMVTRTRVVNAQGGAPRWGQVWGRTLCRLIPFEPLSVLFGREGRGWHDSLPRTHVVLRKPSVQPPGTSPPDGRYSSTSTDSDSTTMSST